MSVGRKIRLTQLHREAECRLNRPKKKSGSARGRRSTTVDYMNRFAEPFLSHDSEVGQAFNGRTLMQKDCCYQSCGIHYYEEAVSQPQEENARNW